MNWEAISAISEIVGAIAVVISLIYVAAQIRQNTKMMRSAAKHSITEASQNFIYTAIDKSEEWVRLTTDQDPSTPEEDARMSLMVRAMLRGFESQCYQYESGLLEDDEWYALQSAIKELCSLPRINKYWQQLKPHMSERLKKVVDG
jgi:hypothetical protein